MADIPEHVIRAAYNARRFVDNPDDADAASVAAVLAALRPEDAHLVPAWCKSDGLLAKRLVDVAIERDEARAEVDRLKAEVERLRNHLEIARGAIGDGGRSG